MAHDTRSTPDSSSLEYHQPAILLSGTALEAMRPDELEALRDGLLAVAVDRLGLVGVHAEVVLELTSKPVSQEDRSDRHRGSAELVSSVPSLLGRGLGSVRRANDVRQNELARLAGTRQGHISSVETGEREPRFSTFCRYAGAIGYRVRLLLERTAGGQDKTHSADGHIAASDPGPGCTPSRR